jgi:hypothetical protein
MEEGPGSGIGSIVFNDTGVSLARFFTT